MRDRRWTSARRGPAVATALLLAGALAACGAPGDGGGEAEPAAGGIPRTPEGHPDLNGVWQAFTTASWKHPRPQRAERCAGGPGDRRGERDPVPAVGRRAAAGELREPHGVRRAAQLLPARRAAHHVHAVPVPDQPDAGVDGHHVRVQPRLPLDLYGRQRPSRGAGVLDGRLARALGGRHAGGERGRLQQPDLVRPRRQLPQRAAAAGGTVHPAGLQTTSATR